MSLLLTGISIGNNNKSSIVYGQSIGSLYVRDQLTAASGTSSFFSVNYIRRPTISAKNTSVTTSNASTLYIEAAPFAGTNETITNAYSLYINAGLAYFAGGYTASTSFPVNGTGHKYAQYSNLYATPSITTTSGVNNYYYMYLAQPSTTGSTSGIAATLYIAGAPKNTNSNVLSQATTASQYSMYVATGDSYFAGNLTVGGALIVSPVLCANLESYSISSKLDTLNVTDRTVIKSSKVAVTTDCPPYTGNQVYTFGQSIPTIYVSCGAGTNTLAYSTDGLKWVGLGTTVFATRGYKAAWNGSMWVAVGDGTNSIAYSYDGINWTGLALNYLSTGKDVLWDGTKWIAVGVAVVGMSNNPIVYSYDGIIWLSATSTGIFSSNTAHCIAYNGYFYLSGGISANAMAYSYDGLIWAGLTGATPNFSTNCFGIAWNGYIWVAVGAGTNVIAWSNSTDPTDYSNWTKLAAGTSGTFSANGYCICWTGTVWLAGGDTNNMLSYSYNGNTWSALGNSIFSSQCYGIICDGTKIIAHGTGTNTQAWSRDGIGWIGLGTGTYSSDGRSTACNLSRYHQVTIPRNRAIAVGGSGGNTIIFSINGSTWTNSLSGSAIFTSYCYCIEYNGSIWLAGGDGSKLAMSKDGIYWTLLNTNLLTTYYGLVWNGTMWLALGAGTTNTMAYSYDGYTWVGLRLVFEAAGFGMSAAWNGSMWVATGQSTNKLVYSYNGLTWTSVNGSDSLFTTFASDVAWNGFMWVAVGGQTTGNRIIYSYDGINWSNTANGTSMLSTAARRVAWSGYMWAVVGSGTQSTAYSTDGINWTNATNIFSTSGYGVRWNGVQFIAVGEGTNKTAYSYDGIVWVAGSGSSFSTRGRAVTWSDYKSSIYIQHPTIVLGAPDKGATIAYAIDSGLQWKSLDSVVFTTAGYCAAWNGSIWVAGGAGTNALAWSQDGVDWIGLGTFAFTEVRAVFWTGNVWVATGLGNTSIAVSPDGRTWTNIAAADGGTILSKGFAIAQNSTSVVIVGEGTSHYIVSSTDCLTWTGQGTANFTTGIYSIAWIGIRWVVAGIDAGTQMLRYSANLSVWTNPSTSTIFTTAGYGLAWNGTRLVAVGSGTNTIAYSDDNGASWTVNNTMFTTAGRGVAWNGRSFIAVGAGTNSIVYSGNGSNWVAVPNNTSIFTTAYGVATNPRLGVTIVDSQLTLGTNAFRSSLDIVSDTSYDRATANFSIAFNTTK